MEERGKGGEGAGESCVPETRPRVKITAGAMAKWKEKEGKNDVGKLGVCMKGVWNVDAQKMWCSLTQT